MADPTRPAVLPAHLPGGTTVDVVLLSAGVAEINRLYREKGLELYRAIGTYVLQAFFSGDPRNLNYRDRHVTFRELASRDDLKVSYVTVWNAVAIVKQLAELPDEVGNAMAFGQHRALLTLKDPERKVELARAAVDEHLTEDELRERVAAAKPPNQKPGGRRPDPMPVKRLKALRASIGDGLERVRAADLAGFDREALHGLVKQGRKDLAAYEKWLGGLEAQLAKG